VPCFDLVANLVRHIFDLHHTASKQSLSLNKKGFYARRRLGRSAVWCPVCMWLRVWHPTHTHARQVGPFSCAIASKHGVCRCEFLLGNIQGGGVLDRAGAGGVHQEHVQTREVGGLLSRTAPRDLQSLSASAATSISSSRVISCLPPFSSAAACCGSAARESRKRQAGLDTCQERQAISNAALCPSSGCCCFMRISSDFTCSHQRANEDAHNTCAKVAQTEITRVYARRTCTRAEQQCVASLPAPPSFLLQESALRGLSTSDPHPYPPPPCASAAEVAGHCRLP